MNAYCVSISLKIFRHLLRIFLEDFPDIYSLQIQSVDLCLVDVHLILFFPCIPLSIEFLVDSLKELNILK